MGTRADFYTGGTDPETMQWLGSIAWDGYPEDQYGNGVPSYVLIAENESEYLDGLTDFFGECSSYTHPKQGWPWPWETSNTTDYAYTFTNEGVRASAFGHQWHDPSNTPQWQEGDDDDEFEKRLNAHSYADPQVEFPDMTEIQNVDYGDRSGLIVIST
jgi:hypothetical protein